MPCYPPYISSAPIYISIMVIKNILDDEIEWTQNSNVIETFRIGTSFNVKLNYEFL